MHIKKTFLQNFWKQNKAFASLFDMLKIEMTKPKNRIYSIVSIFH